MKTVFQLKSGNSKEILHWGMGKKVLGILWPSNNLLRTSLEVQWIRICLPTQGTWVQSLVWEDSTCLRAMKPVHHNYWACALEPRSHNYWSPDILEPALCNKRSHLMEKPARCNWGAAPARCKQSKTAQQKRPREAKQINKPTENTRGKFRLNKHITGSPTS